MNLSFPSLLSILLLGLGAILLISAIRPFTSTLGLVFVGIGVIGIIISIALSKNKR